MHLREDHFDKVAEAPLPKASRTDTGFRTRSVGAVGR